MKRPENVPPPRPTISDEAMRAIDPNAAKAIARRYKLSKREAMSRGWKIPSDESVERFSKEAWIRYWHGCGDYERDPENGRPVVPHRSA